MGKAMTEQEKRYYQDILTKNGLSGLSGTYYQLEKLVDPEDTIKDWYVYRFVTVSNGNMYIEYVEQRQGVNDVKRSHVYHGKDTKIYNKDEGNKKYQELLDRGYTFAGKFVRDVCGYSVKL